MFSSKVSFEEFVLRIRKASPLTNPFFMLGGWQEVKSSNNILCLQKTSGEKYIKNLSNKKMTDAQIELISHGLKFIPVSKVNKNRIRKQLLQDFEIFASKTH